MRKKMNIIDMLSGVDDLSIPAELPGGDMPGVRADIAPGQVDQARRLLTKLPGLLEGALNDSSARKVIISLAGGSGSGKTGIAATLAYLLNACGIGTYVMSGDNYPHRIPAENDAERLRIYRTAGLKGLRDAKLLTPEVVEVLEDLQRSDLDADPAQLDRHTWFATYLESGKVGLTDYLGTALEQDYDEVNYILRCFKNGDPAIYFKRMGREKESVWFEQKDMRDISVLILEWTHAGNPAVLNVDIPILLHSTPEETLAYRLARGRDQGIDSPFTSLVLQIEQGKINASAGKAKLILDRQGQLLDPDKL
jgi:hypothetical protein